MVLEWSVGGGRGFRGVGFVGYGRVSFKIFKKGEVGVGL